MPNWIKDLYGDNIDHGKRYWDFLIVNGSKLSQLLKYTCFLSARLSVKSSKMSCVLNLRGQSSRRAVDFTKYFEKFKLDIVLSASEIQSNIVVVRSLKSMEPQGTNMYCIHFWHRGNCLKSIYVQWHKNNN